MLLRIFYCVTLIFFITNPQAFSAGECSDSFSSNKPPEGKELEKLLVYPIRSFNLSERIVISLEMNYISYIGDLIIKTEAELLILPYIKKNRLSEVITLLSAMGLRLGMANKFNWPTERWHQASETRQLVAWQTEIEFNKQLKGRFKELREEQKAKKELPPVLFRRVITPKEEKILRMRYGIGEKRPHTLKEIGQSFNDVSKERIRQIIFKALGKLADFGEALGIIKFSHKENLRLLDKDQIEELIEAQKKPSTIFPAE